MFHMLQMFLSSLQNLYFVEGDWKHVVKKTTPETAFQNCRRAPPATWPHSNSYSSSSWSMDSRDPCPALRFLLGEKKKRRFLMEDFVGKTQIWRYHGECGFDKDDGMLLVGLGGVFEIIFMARDSNHALF